MKKQLVIILLSGFLSVFGIISFRAISIEVKEIDITAPDGIKLKATYYSPEVPGPGILLNHQCNRDRTSWNFLARKLAESGFHVITYDYRGFGESEGERIRFGAQNWREKWVPDMESVFAFLEKQPGVQLDNLGVGGASCGVFMALEFARLHKEDVKTNAVLSGPIADQYEFLKSATNIPLLSIVDQYDGAYEPMQQIFEASSSADSRFITVKEAGHGTDMFERIPEMQNLILDWFVQYLTRNN